MPWEHPVGIEADPPAPCNDPLNTQCTPRLEGGPYPNLTGGMSGARVPGGGCPGWGLSSGPRRVLLHSVSERVSQYAARRLSVGLRVLGAGRPGVPSRVEGRLRGARASTVPENCGSDVCRGSSGRSGGGTHDEDNKPGVIKSWNHRL